MLNSIELQVISKLLTSQSDSEIDRLCSYDTSYYAVFKDHIKFILDHKDKYGDVPDVFTFQAQFEDITLVDVDEPTEYLEEGLKKNKQHILFLETFNKLTDLGSEDVSVAWEYLAGQCEKAEQLSSSQPMNIVKDAAVRSDQILKFNSQSRIPTGFKELDKLMYGGLSTVEELCVIVARTNAGKAQPLWSKVLTPTGWKQMGDIHVGDIVVGKNNDNGTVVQIFPQGVKDYYRVNFDDGTSVECCKEHLWEVVKLEDRLRGNCNHKVIQLSDIVDSDEVYTVDLCGDLSKSVTAFDLDELDFLRLSGKHASYNFSDLFILGREYKIIINIEYIGKTKCQCILLDNKSHTYITDGYTVTHNTWVTTKMMESAQANGFPVLYYSPEMRSSFIGTRFDTWRGHFRNSEIFRGQYSEEYKEYLKELVKQETGAYVVEDSDMSEGRTTVRGLESLVKKNHIKLLIIDGLSYIQGSGGSNVETHIKYRDICNDLFRLSKTYECAVVVSVQANRDTRENRDEKGEPFPNIYNIAESDHPARIATQVFAIRQIFDKHMLEIRLEKSRTAKNDKPVFSYVWDPNTGTTELIEDDSNVVTSANTVASPTISSTIVQSDVSQLSNSVAELITDDDDYDGIEF